MKRKFSAFLLLCMIPTLSFASVEGNIDKRVVIGWVGSEPAYVKKLKKTDPSKVDIKWNTTTYNNYVCIGSGKGCASGEFISPKHILTNAHVAEGCGLDGKPQCTIQTSDGKTLLGKVVFYGIKEWKEGRDTHKGDDWQILEITTPNFCSRHYFGYVSPTPFSGGMWRAGFGQLRVISDKEFENIRKAYNSAISKWWIPNDKFDKVGLKIDYDNLANSMLTAFQEKFAELTGENFFNDYLFDNGTLKLVQNCSILEKKGTGNARHNCYSWPGDSGGSIQNSSKNQITLLNNSARLIIGGKKAYSFGVRTENIFSKTVIDALNTAKENCKSSPQPKPTPKPQPGPEPTPSNERAIGGECLVSDLPPHASAGHYIKSGRQKYDCGTGGVCSCGATQCESGYYLVVNASGNSQGWCYTRRCPSGKHLNIIDGYKTDTKCVDD